MALRAARVIWSPAMLPSPDSPLDRLFQPTRTAEGWAIQLPDGWQQGRGAFGGLVTAVMIRAMEEMLGDPDRPLRSLTAELIGPAQPGASELQVEPLRAGNAVTTLACRLVQGSEIQAHGVGVFGKARVPDRDALALTAPQPPDWRTLEPIPVEPPLGPPFARFFDFRSASAMPYSGAGEAVVEGWIRPKHPGEKRDAAFVAAVMDAWWPALLATETTPRPMATVAYTLQLCGTTDGIDPAAPWKFRSRDVVVRDGYFVELRELWSPDDRLLALNQQTFAIIK